MTPKTRTIENLTLVTRSHLRLLICAATVLAVLAGCSHVTTQATPYYRDPWQTEGPQGELEAGTHVLVVGRKGTYSQVWSLKAVGVYIWDGALRPLWGRSDAPADK